MNKDELKAFGAGIADALHAALVKRDARIAALERDNAALRERIDNLSSVVDGLLQNAKQLRRVA